MDTKEKRLEKIFDKYKCDDGLMVLLEDEVNEFFNAISSEIKRAREEGYKHLIYVFTQIEPNADKDRILEYISKLERER